MTHRLVHTAALLALAAISTCAPAQTVLQTDPPEQMHAAGVMETEPPGRVGRVSLVRGKVEIGGAIGSESNAALVNWPVTTSNLVTTAPGARTEIRIGSTSIRLDGDSSLEFTELDDDSLRLRLHFGSASIRVMNSEVVPEFELRTAQATVRLTQPGRLRVDADHQPDISLVSVLDGEAQVDGAGASLTVRAGRSAEVRDDDVRTLQAQRDEFDDWSLTRDQTLVAEQSQRHIGTEMTGYEELDRYGSWSTYTDYAACGRRPRWRPTGRPTATANGAISRPGAGPGSTTRPGATRPSITAAGCRCAIAGPGPRAASSGGRYGRRRWSAGSAAAAGASALAHTTCTRMAGIRSAPTTATCPATACPTSACGA